MTQTKFRYSAPLHDLDLDEWSDELRADPRRPAAAGGNRRERLGRRPRRRWLLPTLAFPVPVSAADRSPAPAPDAPEPEPPAAEPPPPDGSEQEWQAETALDGFIGSLEWHHFEHPWPREPAVPKDGVYIIAKQRSGEDWEILKVGKSATLRDRLNGGKMSSGPHTGLPYKELVRRGCTIFWAATRNRGPVRGDGTRADLPVAALERLIARILKRAPGMSGHAEHEPVIRALSGRVELSNPLPQRLAHFGARSFHHDGAKAGKPHARYPRLAGDHFQRDDKSHDDRIALQAGAGHAFEVLPFEFG